MQEHGKGDQSMLHIYKSGFGVTVIVNNNREIYIMSEDITAISLLKILKNIIRQDANIINCSNPKKIPRLIYLKLVESETIIYDILKYYPELVPESDSKDIHCFNFISNIFDPIFFRCFDMIYFGVIIAATEQTKNICKIMYNNYTIFNFSKLEFKSLCDLNLEDNYYNKSLIICMRMRQSIRNILYRSISIKIFAKIFFYSSNDISRRTNHQYVRGYGLHPGYLNQNIEKEI